MTITSRGVSFTILVKFFPDCAIWDRFLVGLSAIFAQHDLFFVPRLLNASKCPWGITATEHKYTDCVGVCPSLYECRCLCVECGYQLPVCVPLPSRGRRADPAIDWAIPSQHLDLFSHWQHVRYAALPQHIIDGCQILGDCSWIAWPGEVSQIILIGSLLKCFKKHISLKS